MKLEKRYLCLLNWKQFFSSFFLSIFFILFTCSCCHSFQKSIRVIVSFPFWILHRAIFWWRDFKSNNNNKEQHTNKKTNHLRKMSIYLCIVGLQSRTNSTDTFYFNFLFWHFFPCVCVSISFHFFSSFFRTVFSLVRTYAMSVNRILSLRWHCMYVFGNKNIDYGKHKSSQIFHFNLQSITIGWRKKRKVKPNTAIDLNNEEKKTNP